MTARTLAVALGAWLDVPAARRAEVVADLRVEAETHRDDAAATRRALRGGAVSIRTAKRLRADLPEYEARALACEAAVGLLAAIEGRVAEAAGARPT